MKFRKGKIKSNFKFSLILLSCLPGIAGKKTKITNSFRNTGYENKLSKAVISIESWVIHALKRGKENNKVFRCNDIVQIIRDHSFSTYGSDTQKLTFLPPDTYRCRVARNASFSENFPYILNE